MINAQAWHRDQMKQFKRAVSEIERDPNFKRGHPPHAELWNGLKRATLEHMAIEEDRIFPLFHPGTRVRFVGQHAEIRQMLGPDGMTPTKRVFLQIVQKIKDHEREEEHALTSVEGWNVIIGCVLQQLGAN
jgi:hypothetical protein